MHKMVILCGGKGVRLKPLTDTIPKALVPLAGKPMINHILDKYSEMGIKEFILCIGHKGNIIKNHLKNNLNVLFVDSGEEAPMLKRIYDVQQHVSDRVVVGYCDTITDINFHDLIEHHKKSGKMLTMVLAEIKSPFGIVEHNHKIVHSFEEKPVFDYYIGTFVLEKEAFSHIDEGFLNINSNEGLVKFFKKLVDLGEVGVYKYHGKQLTFNTNDEKELAESGIKGFYTMGEGSDNGR